jgi:NAD(P)H-dependent flavin oxidoreductase YrpB (nitropropane dioxygenase family)
MISTPITELFGIAHPIVQTGMGWVSGARLTAATSEAGGLGILASATMSYTELLLAIRSVKERTARPFGVNLRADQADVMARADLLIEQRIKVASFAQAPSKELIKRLKDGGVLTMPTIGAVRHAEKVAGWGVDAVIAQGHEGGGHTGAIPTSLLLPEVCRAVRIPVLGAGGFKDGRGLVAALAFGASGIAMGTRFLLTKESTVPDAVKAAYLATKLDGTVVTRAVDGYPQRVIKTPLIERLEKASALLKLPRAALSALELLRLTRTTPVELLQEGLAMKKNQELSWSQLAMAANAPMLTKAALVDGRLEAGILPTGQVAGAIEDLPPVAEVIARIVAEAEQTLEALRRLPTGTATKDAAPRPERAREGTL